MNKEILVAFGSVPKDGGTFTFYRNIRPALKEYGIDLRCVSVGKKEAELWDSAFADDGCALLVSGEADLKKQAMAFVDWCEETGVDIVMGVNSYAILSALPHLPENIRVMSRCANAFGHGYKITLSGKERLARIIATTPRLRNDLVNVYKTDPERIELIPNGICPVPFEAAAEQPRGDDVPLRLGFVGRLEHNQKGVLYLLDIVHSLDDRGVDFIFRIAGKGVHKKALERELKPYVKAGRVRLEGALSPDGVVNFLGKTDVFVFVSRFEGCPNVLLESMMAGCVPVVYGIEGITDFIVKDEKTGFVCPMEDARAFTGRVAELDRDREKLKHMSGAAAIEARARFSNERAAENYARVFNNVIHAPPPKWKPIPWSDFEPDPAFERPGIWQRIVPRLFKEAANNWFFYLGLSDRYYE